MTLAAPPEPLLAEIEAYTGTLVQDQRDELIHCPKCRELVDGNPGRGPDRRKQ